MKLEELLADSDWQHAIAISVDGNDQYWVDYDDKAIRVPVWEFTNTLAEVVLFCEGENDGENWIALFELKAPTVSLDTHAFLDAGCDYTGWDCQAGGTIEYTTLEHFKSKLGSTPRQRQRLGIKLPEDPVDAKRYDWEDDP